MGEEEPGVSLWAYHMAFGALSLWRESERRGVSSLTLLWQRPQGQPPLPNPCTVELLQAFAVILGQAILVRVAHWALVKGPHN